MKRGFLLDKPKAKKPFTKPNLIPVQPTAIAIEAGSLQTKPELESAINLVTAEDLRTISRIQLQYGKVEDTSLPTDFTPDWKISIDTAHGIIKSDSKTLILLTVPPKGSKMAIDENDHSEWITFEATKPRVFSVPTFPQLVPQSTSGLAYEVKMTPNMGIGVFASRDIKFGELVFAERPLLVAPSNTNVLDLKIPNDVKYSRFIMNEYEKVLEAAVRRMSSANQTAFKGLMNSHKEDGSGPLLGVMRTNGYVVNEIYDGPGKKAANDFCRYTVVGNVASRLNHSCMANVAWSFNLAAFAYIFKANLDIKAGEQLFYAYCDADARAAVRKEQLAPYGVVCECRACTIATPERDKFREEYHKRANEYHALSVLALKGQNISWPTAVQFQELLKFQATAIEEGLQNMPTYRAVLYALYIAYWKKGMGIEATEAWELLMVYNEVFETCG